MLESPIEKKLRLAVEAKGGKCWKFVSPGTSGVPDRVCLLPGAKIIWVETKANGKKARPLQDKRHRQLRALGFQVQVIDSVEQIKEVVPNEVHPS